MYIWANRYNFRTLSSEQNLAPYLIHLKNGFQPIGHAGRDGSPCWAYVLTDAREIVCFKDPHLSDFCKSKENCRRQLLLKSSEVLAAGSPAMCCDVCSPQAHATLDIFRQKETRRLARRMVVRSVNATVFR